MAPVSADRCRSCCYDGLGGAGWMACYLAACLPAFLQQQRFYRPGRAHRRRPAAGLQGELEGEG